MKTNMGKRFCVAAVAGVMVVGMSAGGFLAAQPQGSCWAKGAEIQDQGSCWAKGVTSQDQGSCWA